MELRQLAHFVAVAEERSFTRAAERENIVQSGMSASIAALERELGVELFLRLPRGVEPTPAGNALLTHARRVLAGTAAAIAAARASAGSLTGALTVEMVAGASLAIPVGSALRKFGSANPNMTVRAHETSSRTYHALRSGRCDVFISPGPQPHGVASVPLAAWPIVLACAESHPLAREASVHIESLAGERLIDVPESSATRQLVDAAFATAQVERRSIAEGRGPMLLMSMIREGVGLSFVPAVWEAHTRGIRYVRVRPEIGMWELAACFMDETGLSPAAQSFVNVLQSTLTERE